MSDKCSNKQKLDIFFAVVESVSDILSKQQLVEDETYESAQMRMFRRMCLRMREIEVLLRNQHPHGALALSRQVYEALVIMNYINENCADKQLLKRFFAHEWVAALQLEITRKELLCESIEDDEKILNEIAASSGYATVEQLKRNNYWWVAKGKGWKEMHELLSSKTAYTYKKACAEVHVSLFSPLDYLDIESNIKNVIWYAMLNFLMGIEIVSMLYQGDWAPIIEKATKLIAECKLYASHT